MILEKGLAKLYGNMENIVGGWTQEANYALTGYPSTYMTVDEFEDEIDMFDWFEASLKEGDIISLGTIGNGDDSVTNEYGLVMSHAYTVIDTVRLTNNNEETYRLIKMRNPWGSEYYDGDWCDDCSQWTTDYRAKADFTNANDGEIWIADTDLYASSDQLFVNYFVDKATYHEAWIDFTSTTSNSWYSASMYNPTEQTIWVTLNLYHYRMYPYGCVSNYQIGYIEV